MNWKDKTWDLAWRAADQYYENVLKRGKYPGEFNLYKGMDKDDAVYDLAKRYVGKLREVIPEETYNENMEREVDALDVGAVQKFMFEFGEEPFSATRKGKFDKVMDEWYKWGPKETEAHMYDFGYDPAREGDRQKFLAELADYQTAHDRAGIVKTTLAGEDKTSGLPFFRAFPAPVQKFGFAMMPTLTDESTRQSLTGDFDDARAYGAAAIDLGAAAAFGAGGNIKNIVASPLKAAAFDAGVEAARQGINYGVGYETDPMAPVSAGAAGAFAPMGGNWLAHYISKGGNMEAKPIARGFRRGLRGADDPLEAERNELKQMLLDVREASKSGRGTVVKSGKMKSAAENLGDIDKALMRDTAKEKLMSLGFRSAEDESTLDARITAAQMKLNNTQQSIDQLIDSKGRIPEDLRKNLLNEAGKRADLAKKELEDALSAQKAYNESTFFGNDRTKYPYIESVIGGNPEQGKIGGTGLASVKLPPKGRPEGVSGWFGVSAAPKSYPTKATMSVEKVLTKYYDTPVKPNIKTATGYMDATTAKKYKPAMTAIKSQFPEKYANDLAQGDRKKYIAAQQLGGLVGASLKQVEPNLKANPFEPLTYEEKVNNFKKSEWFKNLPEGKKNIIEKVLKGE